MDPNTKLYMMLYGDKGESGRIYLLPDGSKFEPDKFYKVSVNIKDIGNVSRVLLIAHFEKSDSLGPSKLSSRLFMGLFVGDKSSSHLELCRDMQVVVCLSAQVSSGTPLVWHFIEF